MNKSRRTFFLTSFLALILIFHVGDAVLVAHGIESTLLTWLYRAGIIWLFIWWVRTDPRRGRVGQLYCLGLLATVGGIVFWPYYLIRTRGGKGLLLIVAYFGLMIFGSIAGLIVYTLLGGKLY